MSFSLREFLPRSISCLRQGYTPRAALGDLFAGVTVAIIALPLAMALAIASGVTPERGLFTAIVAGFLISALGGSRVQIGGPTGAFVVIVYSIVSKHGYDGLAMATFMAGGILLLLGFARFGNLIKYIPHPVTTGFTTGIALIIFSSQVKDFFGLRLDKVPSDFIEKWQAYFSAFPSLNLAAVLISAGSLTILLFFRRYFPRIPGAIIAVGLSALIVKLLELPVETIGSKFGGIPHSLPAPSLAFFSWQRFQELLPEATTIALLAGIESLLSAVVADGMIGDRHNSNGELVAQGAANIVSVLFGGIPATGAIARTAANIKSGASTPVAGMVHAVVLLLFMLLLAPLASLIPLATLSAILIIVAWNMSEVHQFFHLFKAPRSDVLVLLTSFLLTVLVDLTVAVEVGVVMASLLFMRRMSDAHDVVSSIPILEDDRMEYVAPLEPETLRLKDVPVGVEIFQMSGPFFFGVVDRLKHVLDGLELAPQVFILRMRKVPVIDASGLHGLQELLRSCQKEKTVLILSGVQPAVEKPLKRIGLWQQIGENNICPNIDAALKRAGEICR